MQSHPTSGSYMNDFLNFSIIRRSAPKSWESILSLGADKIWLVRERHKITINFYSTLAAGLQSKTCSWCHSSVKRWWPISGSNSPVSLKIGQHSYIIAAAGTKVVIFEEMSLLSRFLPSSDSLSWAVTHRVNVATWSYKVYYISTNISVCMLYFLKISNI